MMTPFIIAANFPSPLGATDGTAKGEATDEKGQQGLGLQSGSESSNVIKGGPEIIKGKLRVSGNNTIQRVSMARTSHFA